MKGHVTVNLERADGTEVAVTFTVTPGTRDYWAKDPGCWCQGDPAEMEVDYTEPKVDLTDAEVEEALDLAGNEEVIYPEPPERDYMDCQWEIPDYGPDLVRPEY